VVFGACHGLGMNSIMTDKKITPDVVKKIESALEERKVKHDRRSPAAEKSVPVERRTGKDRRND
jgi:hypothetical protein